MATDIDICNRALLLIGSKKVITSLTQDSAEAKACNAIYTSIRDWCLGITNWNFARRTQKLTLIKTNTNPVANPWVDTEISPGWLYEYGLPAECLIIRYVTNSEANSNNTSYIGDPQRFVVANDSVATVAQPVVLTNESSAVAIYTVKVANPTFWPWYFERFVVSALAWNLSMGLLENEKLTQYLDNMMMRYFESSFKANLAEGLIIGDTTPEWIQALGINYPFRRQDDRDTLQPQDAPNDNRSR